MYYKLKEIQTLGYLLPDGLAPSLHPPLIFFSAARPAAARAR
jgi:hypothetical protein